MAKKKTLNDRIMETLKGRAIMDAGHEQGLKDYHTTQAVKNALRVENRVLMHREVCRAIKAYRITARLNFQTSQLEFKDMDGTVILEIEIKNIYGDIVTHDEIRGQDIKINHVKLF